MLNVLFVGGAILIAVYSWAIYGLLTEWLIPLGSAVHPDMQQAFNKEKAAIYIHAMASATALAIGPFQVIPSWRRKHMLGHRRAGRVYFVCCFAGSISGMTLSLSAQGGMVGKVGFFSLGVVWLLSNLVGFVAIVFPKIRTIWLHEAAMQVSCALTYSAVSLRIMLPVAVLNTEHFQPLYGAIAWLCWTVNLVILGIIWLCQKEGSKTTEPAAAEQLPAKDVM